MIRFSDTKSMTKEVLKKSPSIAVYPLLAVLGGHALKIGTVLLFSGGDNPFFAVITILILGVGVIVGLTAFTYPMFRIGYAVANELGRPTHLSWSEVAPVSWTRAC
mgnify:CR=1 FL=1